MHADPPDTVKARLQVQRRTAIYLGTVDAFGKVGHARAIFDSCANLLRLMFIYEKYRKSLMRRTSLIYSADCETRGHSWLL